MGEERVRLPLSLLSVFGVLLVLEVLVTIVILEGLLHVKSWPAFVAMILFFVVHQNRKEIPNIVIGSAFGILNFFLCMLFVSAVAPAFGGPEELAQLISVMIYVAVFVFLIVVLAERLPWLFNAYAFMYFTVAFADLASFLENNIVWIYWLAVELIGGTLLILGVLGISVVVAKMMAKRAAKAGES